MRRELKAEYAICAGGTVGDGGSVPELCGHGRAYWHRVFGPVGIYNICVPETCWVLNGHCFHAERADK